jgi:hypothetical protein
MTWGAVAIAGASVVTGYMGSQSAKKAGDKSASGADAASQVQWDMYDRSRKDQLPWLGTGQNALKMLAALNGVPYSETNEEPGAQSRENFDADAYMIANPDVANPKKWRTGDAFQHWQMYGNKEGRPFTYVNPPSSGGTSTATTAPDYSAFYNSPDYKFTFAEGNRAVNAGLAARGLSKSGRAMKELTRYGQGAASTQLNNYRNQLAAMAGIGQQTAQTVGAQGMQTGQIVGQNTQNAADARASGYMGQSNSWSNAINQGIGTAAYGYGKGWWGGNQQNPNNVIP